MGNLLQTAYNEDTMGAFVFAEHRLSKRTAFIVRSQSSCLDIVNFVICFDIQYLFQTLKMGNTLLGSRFISGLVEG